MDFATARKMQAHMEALNGVVASLQKEVGRLSKYKPCTCAAKKEAKDD